MLVQDDSRFSVADPICTFVFAALVLLTTRTILRDICDILMERVPRSHDAQAITSEFLTVRSKTSLPVAWRQEPEAFSTSASAPCKKEHCVLRGYSDSCMTAALVQLWLCPVMRVFGHGVLIGTCAWV